MPLLNYKPFTLGVKMAVSDCKKVVSHSQNSMWPVTRGGQKATL